MFPVGETARVFFSADPESTGNNSTTMLPTVEGLNCTRGDVDGDIDCGGNELPVPVLAERIDVSYATSKPQTAVETARHGNVTLNEYQVRQLVRVKRSNTTGIVPAGVAPKRGDRDIIVNASVTILGVSGGVKSNVLVPPRFRQRPEVRAVLRQLFGIRRMPLLIGSSGRVLNFADYRINHSAVPDDYCEVTYETREGENGTTLIVGGTKICHEYFVHTQETRKLRFRGGGAVTYGHDEDPSAAEARAIKYDENVSAVEDITPATVFYNITAKVNHTITRYDLRNISDPTAPNGSGDWHKTNFSHEIAFKSTLNLSDQRRVVVTEQQDLNVSQIVLTGETRTTVIVDIRGATSTPSGGLYSFIDDDEAVFTEDLLNRWLWAYMTFADEAPDGEARVTSPWGVYSTGRTDVGVDREAATYATLYDRNGNEHTIRFPAIPETRLYGRHRQSQTRVVGEYGDQPAPRILAYQGYNVSVPWAKLLEYVRFPSNVSLTHQWPLVMREIVITGAPGRLESITSIHGKTEEIPLNRTHVVPVRRPDVEFQSVNRTHVRITVTDPVTGRRLPNRVVYVLNGRQENVTTDGDGTAIINRTASTVQVRVAGDNWRNVTTQTEVFYAGSTAHGSFSSRESLLDHVWPIFRNVLLVSPVVFALLLLRRPDE